MKLSLEEIGSLFQVIDSDLDGYGWRPFPDPVDDAVLQLVQSMLESAEKAEVVASHLDAERALTFLGFARRLAVQAVREREPEFVRQGVVAVAFAGERYDSRDATLVLHLLAHSAAKVGCDPSREFRDALSRLPTRPPEYVNEFASRRGATSILAAGFQEGTDTRGEFIYRQIPH